MRKIRMYINQVVTAGELMNWFSCMAGCTSVRTGQLIIKCALSQFSWLIAVLGNVEFLDLPVDGTPTYP